MSVRVRGSRARAFGLRLVLLLSLVVGLRVGGPLLLPLVPVAHADDATPVSGAFNLGGGLSGSVDERTGQFQVGVPLASVPSVGDTKTDFSLSYSQSRASAGVDRQGFGNGWTVGMSFVDTTTDPVTVYTASGGSYPAETDGRGAFASNLQGYVLHDLAFDTQGGATSCPAWAGGWDPLPARPGVPAAVSYAYKLCYDDGRLDYFDTNGNLVARTDRFGNRTDLSYQQSGVDSQNNPQWEPTAVVDPYGMITTFGYEGSTATVTLPARSDGTKQTTTVTIGDDQDGGTSVLSVTDPAGRSTTFAYDQSNDVPPGLLQDVTSPSGAVSHVDLQTGSAADSAGDTVNLVWVDELRVYDQSDPSTSLTADRHFDPDPDGYNTDDHDYAGNNGYVSTTEDALYLSGDVSYTYTTSISTDTANTVSTYDSAHRLTDRKILARSAVTLPWVLVQEQVQTYPPIVNVEQTRPPTDYTSPSTVTVTSSATSGPAGLSAATGKGRTETSSTQFDTHGRITSATDESGVTSKVTYYPDSDPKTGAPGYGLTKSVVTTSAAGKTVRDVETTRSTDAKSIQTVTQSDAAGSGTLSARNTISYAYDGAGRLSSQTTAWATGAAPPGDGGGPASTTTAYTSTVDAAKATRTVTVRGAPGTPAEVRTTTVLDLVTGLPVRYTDGAGQVTTRAYDAVGRILSLTPPTGLATTTTYVDPDWTRKVPATKTVVEADGHRTLTSYDDLSRVTTVTDNVSKGVFVPDPTTRPVSSMSYSADGSTVTATDKLGRHSSTTFDPLGRVVSKVDPTGITTQTTYNDALNSTKESRIGVGASAPSQITQTAYDALNREVSTGTTYPVSSRSYLVDPPTTTTYDALGRAASTTSDDVTTTPDFAGPGGVPVTTATSPGRSAHNAGTPVLATDATQIDGRVTSHTLAYTAGDTTHRTGTSVQTDALGNVTTATDALGRRTTYVYDGDGRPVQRTQPDGTVSRQVYGPSTGQLMSTSSTTAKGAAVSTTYTYVPAGQPGAGLVKTATNESGTITYGYDADRNRTSVAYPDGSSVSYDYTDTGLLHTMTDITGAVTTYAYNPDASMLSATQVRGGATLSSVGYTYDGLRRVRTTTRGNGLVTTNAYTPNNLLKSQITVDGKGNQVETHTYAYDNHHNVVSRTDTTPKPSSCIVLCTPGPSTYGTFTTTYRYDAYDRLVGSSVYAGADATGTPVTRLDHTLDVSGNIVTTARATSLASSVGTKRKRLGAGSQTTAQVFDAAGQLTSRTVGGTTTKQSYDPEGRVLSSLSGSTTTYRPDGRPATVTVDGATTTFAYWPDGTRRSAATAGGSAGSTTIDYHYGADRSLVNDSTVRAGTSNAGSASASYLLTAGREARTTVSATTAAGKPTGRGAALAGPTTTGAGVGYYLRDRHSSVTALVDSAGAVTNTYAYDAWGAPALLDGRDGTVSGSVAGTAPGASNPLQFGGAAAKAMYTDTALGTIMLPARTYDPDQARFTSTDTEDAHNLYLGFDGNPVTNLDPTGQDAVTDTVLDALYVVVFLISAVLTAGAAAAAFGAVTVAAEVTAALVVPVVAQAVATAANLVGAITSGVRFADDLEPAKNKFLSADDRSNLSNIATVAGSIAGVAGGIAGAFGSGAAEAAHAADPTAADLLADPDAPDGDESVAERGAANDDEPDDAGSGDEPVLGPKRPASTSASASGARSESEGGIKILSPAELGLPEAESPEVRPPSSVAQLGQSANLSKPLQRGTAAAELGATIGKKIADEADLAEVNKQQAWPANRPNPDLWEHYGKRLNGNQLTKNTGRRT